MSITGRFTRRKSFGLTVGIALLLAGILLPGCSCNDETTSGAGLYPVEVHNQWGYIDKTGTVVMRPHY